MPIRIQDNHLIPIAASDPPFGLTGALQAGDGFFETMRHEHGRTQRLELHLARLGRALEHWGLAWPCNPQVLSAAMKQETEHHPREIPLRLRLSVIEEPGAHSSHAGLRPTSALIESHPLQGDYAKPLRERPPYRVGILRDPPLAASRPLAGFKALQVSTYREARIKADTLGWDEAILLNERGELVEACHFNIFWSLDGRWFTPALESGCLPGVMASEVIRLAERLGQSVHRSLTGPEALLDADFMFLTNSVAEIVSVAELEGRRLAHALDDPTLSRITEALNTHHL